MFYAFIAPSEFTSHHDPVRVLRIAAARPALLANPSYDPEHTSLWALADVQDKEPQPVSVTNQKTGSLEDALVCRMSVA
jgi:hypothetical protein